MSYGAGPMPEGDFTVVFIPRLGREFRKYADGTFIPVPKERPPVTSVLFPTFPVTNSTNITHLMLKGGSDDTDNV